MSVLFLFVCLFVSFLFPFLFLFRSCFVVFCFCYIFFPNQCGHHIVGSSLVFIKGLDICETGFAVYLEGACSLRARIFAHVCCPLLLNLEKKCRTTAHVLGRHARLWPACSPRARL